MQISEKKHHRSLLGLKRSQYIEGILGLALLVTVNLLFFKDNLGFLGVHPHPYWLVVLVIATRYGLKGGTLIGLLAGVIMMALMGFGQADLSLAQFISENYYLQPIVFLLTGILFGEIREVEVRKMTLLETELQELKSRSENLSNRYGALANAKEEIDSRIISQEHTLSTLYDAASGLKSLKEDELYPAVLQLLVDFLAIESCSLYLEKDGKMELVAQQDLVERVSRPNVIDPLTGMVGQAITKRETIALNHYVASEENDVRAEKPSVIVAPLLSKSNELLGIVNIEKLPFLKFNPHTIRITSLIADWCSSAMANARTYQSAEDKNINDATTGIYKYSYFQSRFEEEFKRAKRYGLEMSLMIMDLVDFETTNDLMQKELLPVVYGVIQRHLRTMDLVFHDERRSRYYLLLTNTPLAGAEVVLGRIRQEVESFKFRPYGDGTRLLEVKLGTAEFADKLTETPESLINLVKEKMYGA